MDPGNHLIEPDAGILVTGGGGFIGRRVIASLLQQGFTNVGCLSRPSPKLRGPTALPGNGDASAHAKVFHGNLLSREDCRTIAKGARVVYHLAAGRGEKSYPDAYLNSVVTTRNLLDACLEHGCLKRFVNVSSFAAYSTAPGARSRRLDERWPVEEQPALRGQAYCFAKVKQDEMVMEYGRKHGLPYVIVRPGVVYGSGNEAIHSRVGLGTFGLFLHLGGSNRLPLTYVDNCAQAIVLAGIVKGVEGEVFNIVDDGLPSSRHFLRLYKKHVRGFASVYVPHWLSYLLCLLWEKYSAWSHGQLPPFLNRAVWRANWQKTAYTNTKAKTQLGWRQNVPTEEGLRRYFESCRAKEGHA